MSSGNSDVIDLTADVGQERTQAAPPKKRLLPATVLTTSSAVQVVRNPAGFNVPYIGVSGRVLPPSLTGQTRTLPAPPAIGTAAPGYVYTAPNKPVQYGLPNARIVFSIVNSKFFTAKADFGKVAPEVINTFKMIQGAKFDWQTCKWVFPLNAHDILQVALMNQHKHFVEPLPRFTIAAAQLKNQRDEAMAQNSAVGGVSSPEESLLALKGHIPDKVLHQLAPFQREAVQFVMGNKGRALVADEMGLGKTRTAITAAMAYKDDWPVLVVSPSSARHHWQAEILSVLHPDFIDPKDISVVEGSAHPIYKGAQNFKCKVLIISYHLVSKLAEILLQIPFNVVIVDESHYMKNSGARRTKVLMPLLHKARRAILLSGTPALSRPIELFTQLHALAPKQWPHEKDYGKRYCSALKNGARNNKLLQAGFGSSTAGKSWSEYGGASNMEELHMMLTATIMIRRLKKDILKQLPEKQRHIVKVEIADAEKREKMEELLGLAAKFEEKLSLHKKSRSEGAELLKETTELDEMRARKKHVLMELFTMSGEAKLPAILLHLEAFLDNPLSAKVLVFCHHRSVMEGLVRFLTQRGEEYIRIDGQTPSKDRHSRVQHFQTSSQCRVAILAITAAGIALTLTAAATVYFAELFWTPAALMQAEDRAHRIGQASTVKVTYFLAKGSVDELLWPLVRLKMKLLGEIVEGSKELDFSAAMEADVDSTTADADNNVAGSSGLKKSGSSSSLGNKRSLTKDVPVKEEEIGDLAHEIAAEIKLTERELKHQHRQGQKASDDSDNEDEEDSNSSVDDDDAVVAIGEPDPLAQLYMSMHQSSKSAGRRVASSSSNSSGYMSNAGQQLSSAAPFNPSGPLLLSQMPQGPDPSIAGSSASSNIVDISQDDDEQRQPISLMSPEVRAKWRQQAHQQSQASGETVVIDLLDDGDDGQHQQYPSRAVRSSELGGSASAAETAPFDPIGCVHSEDGVGDDGDLQANWTGQFSSTIVQDESGDIGMGDADFSEHLDSDFTGSAQESQHETPQKVQEAVPARREEDEQPDFMLSKKELISRANQAWTSAHLAHAPKAIKPAMKFTPTLKKTDRDNSSSSLNRSLAAAAVSPPALCANLVAATPDASEMMGVAMDVPAIADGTTEEKASGGGISIALEESTGENQST